MFERTRIGCIHTKPSQPMVGQISALDLLVANLAVHFHRSAYLGTLLSTAPRHATIDGVQGGNPIGLPLAQLGEIELILL
jgi:acyl-CoA thioesterase FadM